MKKAIIIGSGIAGIATSIRLAKQGFDVNVYEANPYTGGKLSSFQLGNYRFDAGPSLFTMPQYVKELFELCNEKPEDFFSYHQKNIICQYFWEDGKRLTAYAEKEKFITEVCDTFPISEKKLRKYLDNSQEKYDLTADLFLKNSLHKFSSFLNQQTIKAIGNIQKLHLSQSLHNVNEQLEEPHMVQFYDRFATYNGSSPYQTPGIMSMIPTLEQHFGTFFPKGGMQSITSSLTQLAKKQGVTFHLNTLVSEIIVENKKARAIIANDEKIEADIVISNMDVVPTYRKLLKTQKAPEKTLKQERSSSALIFYWGVNRSFPELDLHNIYFSESYKEEFKAIFEDKTTYHDPTIYINISSKEEKADAPENSENWFVMVNVPENIGQDWNKLIPEVKQNILTKLQRMSGVDISQHIEEEAILDPISIEQKTQSYHGSLYGASSNNQMSAFLRHPNFSSKIKDLYFCGGSVHPGGGIPLCLLSAQIVSNLIQKNA